MVSYPSINGVSYFFTLPNNLDKLKQKKANYFYGPTGFHWAKIWPTVSLREGRTSIS